MTYGWQKGPDPEDATKIYHCEQIPQPPPWMRQYTGLHPLVQDWLYQQDAAIELLERVEKYARSHIESNLAFCCSHGVHRSVAVAEELYRRLNPDATPGMIWVSHLDLGWGHGH